MASLTLGQNRAERRAAERRRRRNVKTRGPSTVSRVLELIDDPMYDLPEPVAVEILNAMSSRCREVDAGPHREQRIVEIAAQMLRDAQEERRKLGLPPRAPPANPASG